MSGSNNWRQGGRGKPRSNWSNYNNRGQGGRKIELQAGERGFLCTCDRFREKDCTRDVYTILNEYANEKFGSEYEEKKSGAEAEGTNVAEGAGEDVDASLEAELAELKERARKPTQGRRFQSVDVGVNGTIFIKTTLEDPCKIGHEIVSTTASTKVQKSKFVLRFIPIEIVCKAYMEDLNQAADELLPKYFTEGNKTFSIVFSHKYNDTIKRDDVIESVAAKVTALNPTNTVDLKAAQLAIIIDVLRKVVCLSVLPDYFALRKYNLIELCLDKAAEKEGKESAKAGEDEKKKNEPAADGEAEAKKLKESDVEKGEGVIPTPDKGVV